MENRGLIDNKVMIYHLSSLKISVGCSVVDNSVHNETNKIRLLSSFSDCLSFWVLFSFQLLKILWVEVIISILKEPMDSDCIFIQEFCQLCFQSTWKDFEQVRHFLVVFNFTLRIEVLEVILKFVNKLRTDVEFLIKLLNLLHSLLVVSICLWNFHELRS